jgi:hypothetical protein
MRNVRTLLQPTLSNGQTVVEHSPRHPNVKGLSLVDATVIVRKNGQKCLLVGRQKGCTSLVVKYHNRFKSGNPC